MKKIIITFLIFTFYCAILSADQLAYITKEQAEKAAAFIKTQKEVLLFCGCCDNDPKIYFRVTDAYVHDTGYQNFYQVIITGIEQGREDVTSIDADLAYVHVNRNGMAQAVGKILGFECDPCIDRLKWREVKYNSDQ